MDDRVGDRQLLIEQLEQERKRVGSAIGERKRRDEPVAELIQRFRAVSDQLQELSQETPAATDQGDAARWSVLTAPEQVAALRQEWSALQDVCAHAHPFVSWEWIEPWYRAYADTGRVFCVTVRDGGDRLAGVAPLFIPERGDGHLHGNELGFAGTYGRLWGYYPEFLAIPGTEPAVSEAVLEAMTAHRDLWRAVRLCRASPGSPTVAHLFAQAPRHGLRLYAIPGARTCVGQPPAKAEDVVGSLRSANLRNTCRASLRRLQAEHPDAIFRSLTDPDELGPVLETMAGHSIRQWRHHPRGSNFGDSRYRMALGGALEHFLEAGQLRLRLLEAAGELIAATAQLLHRDRLYLIQSSWNHHFARYSPSHLILVNALEAAVTEGCTHYDMTSYYDYKSQYVSEVEQLTDVLLLRDGLGGSLELGAIVGREVAATAVRRLGRLYPRRTPA